MFTIGWLNAAVHASTGATADAAAKRDGAKEDAAAKRELAELKGQLAEVTVDAFKGRTFHGTVLVGGFRADIAKNTLQVKIGLDDAEGLLRPDTLTRVRIMVPGSNDASARTQVVVPADWVVRDGTRATVLVMDGGWLRRVDLGEVTDTGDGWLIAGDGIRPGEVIVHPSHASLPDGTRIAPKEETP